MSWEIRKRSPHLIFLDKDMCNRCNATSDLTIHHKLPRSEGGWDELENLEVLCRKCHEEHHGTISRKPYQKRKKHAIVRKGKWKKR